jgi:hypothetical protein
MLKLKVTQGIMHAGFLQGTVTIKKHLYYKITDSSDIERFHPALQTAIIKQNIKVNQVHFPYAVY